MDIHLKATFICTLLTITFALSIPTLVLATSKVTTSLFIVHVLPDLSTIQEAIDLAAPGSIIQVPNGTYNEALVINKSITLIGQGVGKTTLNGTITTTGMQITAEDVTIQGFTVQGYRTDIIVNRSRNIFITENQIIRSLTKGATYIIGSTNVTLTKNTLTNNSCSAVTIYNSTTTQFSQNIIMYNEGVGLFLENSDDFIATDNQIQSNGGDAICAFYGTNMYVEGNILAQNGYRGIWATESSGKVFHNNFVRNHENVRSILSNFTWDDGYPSGGNYWSNYTGNDAYSDANQSAVGSDGIGDVPYVIPEEGEQDNYPLMGNFTKLQTTLATQSYALEFDSNAQVNNPSLNQTGKSLIFNVNDSIDTEGFCRITIPKTLMWSNPLSQWMLTIDDNVAQRGIAEDNNQTYIYFTFPTGSHTIKVTATNMVPENFLLAILLPIFAASCVLAFVLKRRRNKIRISSKISMLKSKANEMRRENSAKIGNAKQI